MFCVVIKCLEFFPWSLPLFNIQVKTISKYSYLELLSRLICFPLYASHVFESFMIFFLKCGALNLSLFILPNRALREGTIFSMIRFLFYPFFVYILVIHLPFHVRTKGYLSWFPSPKGAWNVGLVRSPKEHEEGLLLAATGQAGLHRRVWGRQNLGLVPTKPMVTPAKGCSFCVCKPRSGGR